MVRRFRTTRQYPSSYPSSLPGNQSAVPSQSMDVPDAFDPSHNVDMIPTAPSGVPDMSIVRAVFDSRPPMGTDFFFEDKLLTGIARIGGYNVPPGFVLVLRQVCVKIFPHVAIDLVSAVELSPFGSVDYSAASNAIQSDLSILIDGVPAAQFANGNPVRLFDYIFADIEIPCWILADGGTTVKVFMTNVSSADGVTPTEYDAYIQYSGNLLMSTGRNLISEPGNGLPLPVRDVSK